MFDQCQPAAHLELLGIQGLFDPVIVLKLDKSEPTAETFVILDKVHLLNLAVVDATVSHEVFFRHLKRQVCNQHSCLVRLRGHIVSTPCGFHCQSATIEPRLIELGDGFGTIFVSLKLHVREAFDAASASVANQPHFFNWKNSF